MNLPSRFRLDGRVAVITGGAGLLGTQHALAIAEMGGRPVLWDLNGAAAENTASLVERDGHCECGWRAVNVTDEWSVHKAAASTLAQYGRIDILINNAARNPTVDSEGRIASSRLESFARSEWDRDLAVGLTGAFLCAQEIGQWMANHGGGVILNISSDLGAIAPDQRLYRQPGLKDDEQPVKPVSYSVVKHGLIGLTRYLATYWPDRDLRANALLPGGVRTDQPNEFVERLSALIPMGRMAKVDEYRGAIQFLCSDASAYMNGACVSIDGGRTAW